MRLGRAAPAAVLAALLAAALPAAAQAAPASLVQQKLAMVDRVLNQSALPGRVIASGNETAGRHVANARELLGHAHLLLAAGQPAGADSVLNGAIWEIGRARQIVPDPAARVASERARETQQQDKAFHEAAARIAGQTLVYERRFADARQEFDFELEQHRSFERLVPLAVARLKPGPEALAEVDRWVARARTQRERGEAAAASDIAAGIRHVAEGTDSLRRALQAAGLVVPQGMGSER